MAIRAKKNEEETIPMPRNGTDRIEQVSNPNKSEKG
jgi:hypothetical protein